MGYTLVEIFSFSHFFQYSAKEYLNSDRVLHNGQKNAVLFELPESINSNQSKMVLYSAFSLYSLISNKVLL